MGFGFEGRAFSLRSYIIEFDMGNLRVAPEMELSLQLSKDKIEAAGDTDERTTRSFLTNFGTFFYFPKDIGEAYKGMPMYVLYGITPSIGFSYSTVTEIEKESIFTIWGGLTFQAGLEIGLKIHGRDFKLQGRTSIAGLSYMHQSDKQGEAKSSSNTVSFRSLGIWRGEISTYLFMRL